MVEAKELVQFEKDLVELWKAGKIRVPLHLSGGNEWELVRVFQEIKEHDWVVSTHRNHYHALLKGVDKNELRQEILGNSSGLCGGASGSMHTTDMDRRFISSCLVGAGAPVAVGLALGIELAGGPEHVWCFLGDGAVDEGSFWESLQFAEGRDLPVTFIIEDNNRSVESTGEDRGVSRSTSRMSVLLLSKKVRYHTFKSTWPHVGNGEYVSF